MQDYDYQKPITEWRPSMVNIEISELEQIMRQTVRKKIKSQLENNCYENKYVQNIYNKNMDVIKENKPWYFVTVSPRDDIELEDFRKKIDSITKWKILIKGYYVFEQRGDSEHTMGNGFHVHLLIEKYNIEYKRLIKRLEDTFKNYCGKPYKNTINVVRKKTEHAMETLDEYMMGDKQEDKETKCDFDKLWRKENKIKDIYKWGVVSDGQDNSKTGADGRVNNGGIRAGAGRKKKEIKYDKVNDEFVCEYSEKNTILEF